MKEQMTNEQMTNEQMTNEQMTNEQMTNEQMTNEQLKTIKPKNLSDLYKIGVIISLILGCFGALTAVFYIFLSAIPALAAIGTTPALDPEVASVTASANVVIILVVSFLAIAFVPYITLVILGIKTLKEKTYKYRIVMSILSIMFGFILGIIAGVLMLVAERDDK